MGSVEDKTTTSIYVSHDGLFCGHFSPLKVCMMRPPKRSRTWTKPPKRGRMWMRDYLKRGLATVYKAEFQSVPTLGEVLEDIEE